MLRLRWWSLCWALLAPCTSHALGPHELLLLVNDASPRSIELANYYAQLRQIPPVNIVHLDLPSTATDPSSRITREEFARAIWEPAQAAIRERRIGDHILAWAYSADFPVLITGDPEVSLTGITLVGNQLPDAELIRKGAYTSRLFAGPGQDLKQRGTPGSLEQYAVRLMTNMPLPSIILAHTGSRGESVGQAIRRLQSTARQNGNPLPGQVFFLTSDDIRTKCRSWQFEDAAAELKKLGQTAQILPLSEATSASQAWGLMAGIALPSPTALPRLVPGSLAEHLTSYAAIFNGHDYQTKMTAWLRAGAAGSAGTVTEPLSIWTKFPNARLFVYYASGCTLLESFAQSIASPLQSVVIGDPLLAPWAKPQGITLINLNDQTDGLKGAAEFAASTWASPLDRASGVFFLLDGHTVLARGEPPVVRINTTELSDGYHDLRAITYSGGAVRQQGFTILGFTTANRNRSVSVVNLTSNETLRSDQPKQLQVHANPAPRELALVHHERVIDRQPYTESGAFRLDPSHLGLGPNSVQVAAIYEDGETVRSYPTIIQVEQPSPGAGTNRVRTELSWSDLLVEGHGLKDGELQIQGAAIQLSAAANFVLAQSRELGGEAEELTVSLTIPNGEQSLSTQQAVLAFDIQDQDNFCLAAWHGVNGAWGLGRMVNGVWKPTVEWGATLEADHTYTLRVQKDKDGGVSLDVDGLLIGRSADLQLKGPYGLGAGKASVTFFSPGLWQTTPKAAAKP